MYFFLGTDLITIRNNKFYSIALLNRERITSLELNVQCHIKSTKSPLSKISTKVFNITVMDLNDNTIKVEIDQKTINVTLVSPYFVKVGGNYKFP